VTVHKGPRKQSTGKTIHGRKGFVIPTKSYVKTGITKKFVTAKFLFLSTIRLVAATKFLVAATKKLFVVPNFVAVTKQFFKEEINRNGGRNFTRET